MAGKQHEINFRSDENLLNLGCGGGCKGIEICQNSTL